MTFLDFFYIIRTKITSHLYLKFKIGLSGVLDWAWIPPSFFRKLKSWGNSGVGLDLVTGSFSEDFSWALAAIRGFMMLEVNSGISGESVKWLVEDEDDTSGDAEVSEGVGLEMSFPNNRLMPYLLRPMSKILGLS